MSTPSPSTARGEIVLQPAYFTSSPFVHAVRADIDALVHQYSQQFNRSTSRPFALFKDVWQSQGWPWLQFKVFDARSRAAFLSVTMRLFSEHIDAAETPLNRAAALFGLYTMLSTQPAISAPSLYSVAQVPVTCDLYEEILELPNALDGACSSIRPHVVYIQSKLLEAHVFQILPRSEMHPLNPRALPREVVVEDGERQKRGRPSKREKTKRARESLVALDGLCDGEVVGPSRTRELYAAAKSVVVVDMGAATARVSERIATIGR